MSDERIQYIWLLYSKNLLHASRAKLKSYGIFPRKHLMQFKRKPLSKTFIRRLILYITLTDKPIPHPFSDKKNIEFTFKKLSTRLPQSYVKLISLFTGIVKRLKPFMIKSKVELHCPASLNVDQPKSVAELLEMHTPIRKVCYWIIKRFLCLLIQEISCFAFYTLPLLSHLWYT